MRKVLCLCVTMKVVLTSQDPWKDLQEPQGPDHILKPAAEYRKGQLHGRRTSAITQDPVLGRALSLLFDALQSPSLNS